MLPTEIRVNNGSSVDFELTASVKGTESDLRLNTTGIPNDWVSVTPNKFEYPITDSEVNFSVKLTAPPNANGTRDIHFQLIGANLNSTVYAASLSIVVPTSQQCSGLVCRGYTVLDASRCVCVCNITCPDVTDLDTASCICKHSTPISSVPPTPPPPRQGQNAILGFFAIALIVFLLQLTWVVPLVTFLRLKRII
jgi:hypothetical protein